MGKKFHKLIKIGNLHPMIKFYIRPKLKSLEDLRTGEIIEALPGTIATRLTWHSEPIMESPTGVFGYYAGTIKSETAKDRIFAFIKNDSLVGRIYPNTKEMLPRYSEIKKWGSKEKIYLCLGTFVGNMDSSSKNNDPRELNKDHFFSGNAFLSEEYLLNVENVFKEFTEFRGKKEYVFSATDGKEYSLKQILLNLKEKK